MANRPGYQRNPGAAPPGTRNARTGLPVGGSSSGGSPPKKGGCAVLLLSALFGAAKAKGWSA